MDLNVVAEGKKRKKNKITVYTEDNENILFVKAILKTKASILDFVDVTLPCVIRIGIQLFTWIV